MLEIELRALTRARRLARLTSRRPWICSPCRNTLARRPQWRAMGTAPVVGDKKPFYVTTPIFYVNAAPHVGHMYTMVLADVLKRWQVLLGNRDAKLLTGTDEHGLKIQQAAAALGMKPQDLCNENCQTFRNLASAANVDHDHFIRTTDSEHKDAVRYFWDMLNHRGYIYTSKHEGWYSVSDEAFYPISAVQPIVEPQTGRKLVASIETGKEVQWTSEENYHFRLSAFKDRLLEFYRNNPDFITPRNYMTGIMRSVSTKLEDLSISRPTSRLKWGIPVPYDNSQVIYVWLDALVNYLTYAGYPFPPNAKSIWPADVHVVGKDILRFHSIYWPAFLMALDLPLPRRIMAHAHWKMNHEKMSKSTNNVVNPHFAIDRHGLDTMRFFLIIDGPQTTDSNYDNAFIVERYKKDLQGILGNLTSRLMRSKRWNVRESITIAVEGRLPETISENLRHKEFLESMPDRVKAEMEQLDPRRALNSVMEIIKETNRFFHNMSPWALTHHVDLSRPSELDWILYNTAESLRIGGILLQPFMPQKAALLLNMLGVSEEVEKRSFSAARYGADADYGVPSLDLKRGKFNGTLFPPLLCED
ncbi:methionine-tRNA ligase [Helicocarpus griseus UAMH5409]|uniref:Probable methionine--tRNA ligase, mitochondrial n=1 Tax=Helicocarpus griseus UAMH5409 TaxID=1447875 RepID=A0A2B7Y385_9EURO|nr:methionine-tRNA ligase [Helicocarpus griseus UAMH5409]